jgi:protein-disulfide isomerase
MLSPICLIGSDNDSRGYTGWMRLTHFIAAGLLLTACSSTSAQPTKRPSPTDVVATVGATSITLAQVDDKALEQSASSFGAMKLSQALYEARRSAVDELIATALMDQEAKTRGVDRAALVEKEITSKVPQVADAEVAAWYQANQSRVQGATIDQVRQPIRAFLLQERTQAARRQFVESLKNRTPVRVMLEPPRQNVTAANGARKGPATAPVQIVEFSDFQCPFCQRAHATVQQVLDTYGDRVQIVYRHFPLPNHPNARPAAEASQCAAEQGKFWPYHDKLFASPSQLSEADLKKHATQLGLDASKFDACVDSHKYKAQVEADAQAGEEAGVNGTPAFFINGRLLSGAQPFEAFKRIIDDELSSKR